MTEITKFQYFFIFEREKNQNQKTNDTYRIVLQGSYYLIIYSYYVDIKVAVL